jgi:CRP-like cAMP-binding protein
VSLEFLRRLTLFADLPEADLRALYDKAEPLTLAAGDWLMREGELGDSLYVVLEGGIEITKRSGEQEVALALRGPGEVIGEMALLEQTPRSATGRAAQASRLLKIEKDAFRQVLSASPTAALALLRTFNMRLHSTEALLRQNEKMASLGTLAAGLAHELNNPAAAVKRSAAQLRGALSAWQSLTSEVDALAREPRQRERLAALRAELPQRAASPLSLDPLTRGDRESELQAWLEARGGGGVGDCADARLVWMGNGKPAGRGRGFSAPGALSRGALDGRGLLGLRPARRIGRGRGAPLRDRPSHQSVRLSGPGPDPGRGRARRPGKYARHSAAQAQRRRRRQTRVCRRPAAHRSLWQRTQSSLDEPD